VNPARAPREIPIPMVRYPIVPGVVSDPVDTLPPHPISSDDIIITRKRMRILPENDSVDRNHEKYSLELTVKFGV
jgi:hypothetical protein